MSMYEDDHDENALLSGKQWDRHASNEKATALFSGNSNTQGTFPGIGFQETENQYSLKYKKAQKAEQHEAWQTRPADDGSEQLGLDRESAMQGDYRSAALMQPKDEAEHTIKVNNPHLSPFQFHTYNQGATNEVRVSYTDSRPTATGRETDVNDYAGHLNFLAKDMGDGEGLSHPDPDDLIDGEVKKVNVANKFRGADLATAMWDYANLKHKDGTFDVAPVHSAHRSVAGDRWAKYVGGPSRPRMKGHGDLEY